jgi:hypothetical protein
VNPKISGILKFLEDHYWDPKAAKILRYWDSNSPGIPIFLGGWLSN